MEGIFCHGMGKLGHLLVVTKTDYMYNHFAFVVALQCL